MLHHKVKTFDTQLKVFEQLTVAQAVLDNPETACREINRVLGAAICYRRPVYIELPRDMVSVKVVPVEEKLTPPDVDKGPFKEALAEAVDLINQARNPVLVAGVELLRYGMQNAFKRLVEKTNLPVTSTFLGKSATFRRIPSTISPGNPRAPGPEGKKVSGKRTRENVFGLRSLRLRPLGSIKRVAYWIG